MFLTRWLRVFLNWLTGKTSKQETKELKEILTEKPILSSPPIRKGSLEDIRDFCDEMRKDLLIRKGLDELQKKTNERLCVELGNLKDKIERFLGRQR